MTIETTSGATPEAAAPRPSLKSGTASPAALIWIALFGLWLAPAVTVTVSPLMNSAAMDARAINEAQIGLVRTFEILLNAGLTIWLASRLARLEARTLGLIGAALVLVGNLASIPGTGMIDLIAARLAAGAGTACMMTAGSALVARIQSPQRAIGILSVPLTIGSVVAASVAGPMMATQGQAGAFGVVAICALIAIPFCLAAVSTRTSDAGSDARTSVMAMLRPFIATLRSPYVIASALCYFGGTAVWNFFARIGLSHDLNGAQIGAFIGGVSIAAGLMALVGAAIRDKWVPLIALAATLLYAAANVTMAIAPNATLFIAAFALNAFGYVLIQNTFTVIGVRLDRTGGINAAGNGWASLVNAGAPAIGGLLITATGSFAPLALLVTFAGIVTVLALHRALRNLPPI